jgi:chemotaxis protein CheX
MKQEYVNPFLTPAQMVWQKEFGCPLKIQNAEAVSNQYTTDDVTAIIGISGKLEGNVLYGFSNDLVKQIVSRMIGEEFNPRDPIALSALGEIANVITGNAATQLAASGYPCDISPPVILEPVGATLTAGVPKQIQVTFESEMGLLRVRVGLAESAESEEDAA